MGEPNEMRCSPYDVHADPEVVVRRARDLRVHMVTTEALVFQVERALLLGEVGASWRGFDPEGAWLSSARAALATLRTLASLRAYKPTGGDQGSTQ
jgi:hypothetical protein